MFDSFAFDFFDPFTSDGATLFQQALEAYVKTNLNVPIWADHIPQKANTYPQMVYRQLEDSPEYTIAGATSTHRAEYDITVVSRVKLDAFQLAKTLRTNLESLQKVPFGGMTLLGCRTDDQEDDYIEAPDGSDNGYWTVTTPYIFYYLSN